MRLVPLVVLLPAIASVTGLCVGRIPVLAAAVAVTGTGAAARLWRSVWPPTAPRRGARVSLWPLDNVVHRLSAPAAKLPRLWLLRPPWRATLIGVAATTAASNKGHVVGRHERLLPQVNPRGDDSRYEIVFHDRLLKHGREVADDWAVASSSSRRRRSQTARW